MHYTRLQETLIRCVTVQPNNSALMFKKNKTKLKENNINRLTHLLHARLLMHDSLEMSHTRQA